MIRASIRQEAEAVECRIEKPWRRSPTIEVLRRELGVDGLARFLRLHRSGPADYTKDRMHWQKDMTVDQILDSIKRRRY
jgi:hypothetical protein